MIKRIIAQIPNSITCLNLLSGCLACIFAFSHDVQIGSFMGYQWVFIFIGAAALFDFCDGASARLLHLYSLMGKELDSLADLISFGLAPALLMFNTLGSLGAGWMAYLALAIPVFGALRLAKFNVDELQATSFRGLPIPANAIFWIGICALINENPAIITNNPTTGHIMMAFLLIAISLLMISNVGMFSLKFKNFDWRENFKRYAILVAAILFVVMYGIPGFAWTICLYILISVFSRSQEE